jgi:replication factor A1
MRVWSATAEGQGRTLAGPTTANPAANKTVLGPAPTAIAAEHTPASSFNQRNRTAAHNPGTYSYRAHGEIVKSDAYKISPIGALTADSEGWAIRVRVISKTPIRTWNNERGTGQLFGMLLSDESGEIRCTCFQGAVDKFYDVIQTGKAYTIAQGQVRPANKQFNPNSQFELTLDQSSVVELCDASVAGRSSPKASFIRISDLETTPPNALVNVIGVVKSVGEITKVVIKKTNDEMEKRDVQITDDSGKTVQLTLWDSRVSLVSEADVKAITILTATNVRVSDFGGRSLKCAAASLIELNIDHPRVAELRRWWQSKGSSATLASGWAGPP